MGFRLVGWVEEQSGGNDPRGGKKTGGRVGGRWKTDDLGREGEVKYEQLGVSDVYVSICGIPF